MSTDYGVVLLRLPYFRIRYNCLKGTMPFRIRTTPLDDAVFTCPISGSVMSLRTLTEIRSLPLNCEMNKLLRLGTYIALSSITGSFYSDFVSIRSVAES